MPTPCPPSRSRPFSTWRDRKSVVTLEGFDGEASRGTREAQVYERTDPRGEHRTLMGPRRIPGSVGFREPLEVARLRLMTKARSTPSPLARLVARIVGRVHEDDLERSRAVHLDDPLALPPYPGEMRRLRREHEIGASGKLARPPLAELLAHPQEHRSLDDGHVLVHR